MIIGIVGCGGIARAHVNALCLNPLVTGLALYDVSPDNVRQLREISSLPVTNCQDLEQLAGVSQGFIICTPNHLHVSVAEEVLRYKQLPFVCEKPLSTDLNSARYLQEIAPKGSIDRVIIATGELWQPRRPPLPGEENFSGTLITSRDYQEPEAFKGKNILIIGGGVSGADIASDLVPFARSVSLSVKKMGLYLPRQFPTGPNDMMHSYLGRCLLSQMNYEDFIGYLDTMMPDYMQAYRASGLLPDMANNNAVHVNEKIIPNVAAGLIKVKPLAERFTGEGAIKFVDASQEKYDVIITCTGYEMPDYSFIQGFDRTQLYEHFFWTEDPSLAVINPPVDTAGFGAAFPYFDIISQWVMNVFSGNTSLPEKEAMRKWCAEHMASLHVKRFYDSWLETIRIGLLSGLLPDPARDFSRYWNIISSMVKPAYLATPPAFPEHGMMDSLFDFRIARIRILSGLGNDALGYLLKKGDITDAEYRAALEIDPRQSISVHLPYSQTYL